MAIAFFLPSFRPSVRLSHAAAVTKRIKTRSRGLCRRIAHHPSFWRGKVHLEILRELPRARASNRMSGAKGLFPLNAENFSNVKEWHKVAKAYPAWDGSSPQQFLLIRIHSKMDINSMYSTGILAYIVGVCRGNRNKIFFVICTPYTHANFGF